MNKRDFIEYVAKKNGVTKKEATDSVEMAFGGLIDAIQDYESLSYTGLGTFETVYVDDAIRRNPRTGEDVFVEAHYALRFHVSPKMRKVLMKG